MSGSLIIAIVAAAVVLVSLGLGGLVRRSGRTEGRKVAHAYRQAVESELAAQLSRRIGVPMRTVVRERAELEGALAELSVQVARAESKVG